MNQRNEVDESMKFSAAKKKKSFLVHKCLHFLSLRTKLSSWVVRRFPRELIIIRVITFNQY